MQLSDQDAIDIIEYTHRKCLNFRNLESVVNSVEFIQSWEAASKEAKKQALKIITEGLSRKDLTVWIKENTPLDFNERSLRALRRLARKIGINNYGRETKERLVFLIKRREKDANIIRTTRGS